MHDLVGGEKRDDSREEEMKIEGKCERGERNKEPLAQIRR